MEVVSLSHSVVYTGLLICAFLLDGPQPITFILGLTHGILWIGMSITSVFAVRFGVIALYTTAWQVLKAAGDPRTAAVAHSSRRELMARAERIPDAEARRDFLAVAEHRWILTEPTDDR